MPLERRDGRLHGPGVLDMKAGVSMGLLATRAVFETAAPPRGSVAMLCTSDEETGSRTSRTLIEAEARASDAVLVLEPALAGGALKTSRKGIGQFHLHVTGVAAHAGVDPAKGVSAVRELARQILDLERLHDLERGVSVNAGVIAGGTRPNVVAEEALAIVDVRAPSLADAARVDAAFRALRPHLPGARLAVTGGFERPPMERSAGVAALYAHARPSAAELGQTIAEGGTGGGFRRQLHRGARRADPRRTGRSRRRRSRSARARGSRAAGATDGAAGRAHRPAADGGRIAAPGLTSQAEARARTKRIGSCRGGSAAPAGGASRSPRCRRDESPYFALSSPTIRCTSSL